MPNSGITDKAYTVLTKYFQSGNHVVDGIDWENELRKGQNSEYRLDKHLRSFNVNSQLFNLLMDAEEEIRVSTMKRSGFKNIGTIMNKVCKENAKDISIPNSMNGGFRSENNDWYVMTPYYALKTDKDVSLPPIPESSTSYPDIVNLMESSKRSNHFRITDLPEFTDLKLMIKSEKSAKGSSAKIPCYLKSADTYINARHLERIYEFMGADNIFAYAHDDPERRKSSPIIFTNCNGEEAIVSTVRPD